MEQDARTVRVQMSEQHFLAAMEYLGKPREKALRTAIGPALLLGGIITYMQSPFNRDIVFALFLLDAFLFLMICFIPSQARAGWRKQYRSSPDLQGEQRFTFTADGLEWQTRHSTTRYRWEELHHLWDLRDFLYIYWGVQSILIFPKLLLTEQQVAAVYAYLPSQPPPGKTA